MGGISGRDDYPCSAPMGVVDVWIVATKYQSRVERNLLVRSRFDGMKVN